MSERLGQERLIEYVSNLLEAFPGRGHADNGKQASDNLQSSMINLVGSLSQQEERVLRRLAAGLSNAEIAQELVVSVNTVKTHVKSIYRKLNVNSRRAAREAARRSKLL